MIIRKSFKIEGSHIVRNCSTYRCSHSIHGHSGIVEVMLEADQLDKAGMVVDFGLLKGPVRDVIDSFDHAYSLWAKESKEYKEFIKKYSDRWIEMPCSPTAEFYAVMFYAIIKRIIERTAFNNGESPSIRVHSVRYHETDTGYAEAFESDYWNIWNRSYKIEDIIFSSEIKSEWKDPKMWDKIISSSQELENIFVNPVIEQQIQ